MVYSLVYIKIFTNDKQKNDSLWQGDLLNTKTETSWRNTRVLNVDGPYFKLCLQFWAFYKTPLRQIVLRICHQMDLFQGNSPFLKTSWRNNYLWTRNIVKKVKVLSSSCFSVCLLLSVLDTGLRPKVLANKCGKIYKLLIAVGDLLCKYHVSAKQKLSSET